jgi:hypothetical protein
MPEPDRGVTPFDRSARAVENRPVAGAGEGVTVLIKLYLA